MVLQRTESSPANGSSTPQKQAHALGGQGQGHTPATSNPSSPRPATKGGGEVHRSGSGSQASSSGSRSRRPASALGALQTTTGGEGTAGEVPKRGRRGKKASSPKQQRFGYNSEDVVSPNKHAKSPTKEDHSNSRFFYTPDARDVSARLAALAASSAEGALARKGLLGGGAVDAIRSEGVRTGRDGKYDVSVRTSAIQRRNTSDMRRSLEGLRDSVRGIGVSIDVSRGKSLSGRMQGEKWMDAEIEEWKLSASRALSTLDGVPTEVLMAQGLPGARGAQADLYADPWAEEERAAEEMHRAKGVWNKVSHERRTKERQLVALREELGEIEDFAEWMDRADGEKSRVQGVVSTLREGISEYDMHWHKEREDREEMEELSRSLRAEIDETGRRVEAMREEIGRYTHDVEGLALQLRQTLHGVEKSLGQGKIHTMRQVRLKMHGSYVDELESRVSQIRGQIEVKRSLCEYEERLATMTAEMKRQFDPAVNSPRRNTLMRKAKEFETAFTEMKQRLGDQDLGSIVELLKRQEVSQQSWKDAVTEHETRVQALEEELKGMVRQKKTVMLKAAAEEVGDGGGARVQADVEFRLDQQLDRLEEAMGRVEEVRDLTSKVGECLRNNIRRVRACAGLEGGGAVQDTTGVEVEGAGGLLEMLEALTGDVTSLMPNEEEWRMLQVIDAEVVERGLHGGGGAGGGPGRSESPRVKLIASSRLVAAFGGGGGVGLPGIEGDHGEEAVDAESPMRSLHRPGSAVSMGSLASTGVASRAASAPGSHVPSPSKGRGLGASLGDSGMLSEGQLMASLGEGGALGDAEGGEAEGAEGGAEGGGEGGDPHGLVMPEHLASAIRMAPEVDPSSQAPGPQTSPNREYNCRVHFHMEDHRHMRKLREERERDEELLDDQAAAKESAIMTRDDVKRRAVKTLQKGEKVRIQQEARR